MTGMDSDQLQDAIIRFHVMRAQESRQHLATLLRRMREIVPAMDDARLSRLAVALDEEITRANLRWIRATLGDPTDPIGIDVGKGASASKRRAG